jgi:Fic family protein
MNLSDYKAGRYERRNDYRSFKPALIHHEWVISDPAILALNSEADRLVGELNAFAQLVPDIEFFISMYVAKEATQSSRIEGTQTNIEDAFKDAEDLDPEARDDWGEVQNYIRATNQAIARLATFPLANRLLRDAHEILMQGVRGQSKRPGLFRVSQNWIGVSLKNAVFVPPHHDLVEELMADLEQFLHSNTVVLPPLIKIAIAHYQFETIHPFLDGNGRLGRLMIALYLASERHMTKPALYLSDYFERNKTAYIDHMIGVREGNHLREWLVFFLHGVAETARASAGVFKNVLALKEEIEREVMPRFSKRRQDNAQALMRQLYARPVTDAKIVQANLETSPNTAMALIDDFVAHGVLTEVTGQRRNRLFVFAPYIALFRDVPD